MKGFEIKEGESWMTDYGNIQISNHSERTLVVNMEKQKWAWKKEPEHPSIIERIEDSKAEALCACRVMANRVYLGREEWAELDSWIDQTCWGVADTPKDLKVLDLEILFVDLPSHLEVY